MSLLRLLKAVLSMKKTGRTPRRSNSHFLSISYGFQNILWCRPEGGTAYFRMMFDKDCYLPRLQAEEPYHASHSFRPGR
jgi:hypothetical protein